MQTHVLNYRIIIEPDQCTGTDKPCFTAYCPTLGVADSGATIEKALENVRGAITAFVESLAADNVPIPVDKPERDIVTTTQVTIQNSAQFA